jgi:hypothetical protein
MYEINRNSLMSGCLKLKKAGDLPRPFLLD